MTERTQSDTDFASRLASDIDVLSKNLLSAGSIVSWCGDPAHQDVRSAIESHVEFDRLTLYVAPQITQGVARHLSEAGYAIEALDPRRSQAAISDRIRLQLVSSQADDPPEVELSGRVFHPDAVITEGLRQLLVTFGEYERAGGRFDATAAQTVLSFRKRSDPLWSFARMSMSLRLAGPHFEALAQNAPD